MDWACEVVRSVRDLIYEVLVKPAVLQSVHAQQLKPCVHDVISGKEYELFHHTTGYKEMETAPE